jgi:hypothetical protein
MKDSSEEVNRRDDESDYMPQVSGWTGVPVSASAWRVVRDAGLRLPAPTPLGAKRGNRVKRDFRGEFRPRVLVASR